MKASHFLLMLFVLTPIAAVETALAGALIAAFTTPGMAGSAFGLTVFSVIAICGLTLLTHWIRYGEDTFSSPMALILDVPFAIIRLPLQLISVILGIISFFNDNLEVDPKNYPEMEKDGFFGVLFIHFLQIEPPSAYTSAVNHAYFSDINPSDDPREYKWENFRYQIKLWFVTLLHSGLYIPLILWMLSDEGIQTIGIFSVPIFILIPVVYFLSCFKGAEMRDITTHDEYYDNTSTRHTYYEYSEEQDRFLKTGDYTIGPGWRSILSVPFLLFAITGILWIIPQTIAVIIALVTPPNAPIVPCRRKDVDIRSLGFFDRILLLLFGFYIDN